MRQVVDEEDELEENKGSEKVNKYNTTKLLAKDDKRRDRKAVVVAINLLTEKEEFGCRLAEDSIRCDLLR